MTFDSLMPLSFSRRCFGGGQRLRHFPADFPFDDFLEGNVRSAEAGALNEGTIDASTTRIELAHAARNHVYEHIRVADFS